VQSDESYEQVQVRRLIDDVLWDDRDQMQFMEFGDRDFLPNDCSSSRKHWVHPLMPSMPLTIPGKDGDHAPRYLEKELIQALKSLEQLQAEQNEQEEQNESTVRTVLNYQR
jgi:hypothetical protein